MNGPILEIDGFSGGFVSRAGEFTPVLHDVSYSLERGAVTAVVGETGSGKSVTALSVLQLQAPGFRRTGGQIRFDGTDLLSLDAQALRAIRGRRISMVFQDARAALNPVFSVGQQLADTWRLHNGGSRAAAMEKAVDALRQVQIPEPERRARQYPHEFSGGMAQRAMIALAALICTPELLLLDEPTTGLDVTTQADIMELLLDLARSRGLTVCLITHDLGVVAETCDHVVVMNRGRVVETGSAERIFTAPQDPYTRRLLAASVLTEDAG
ncbi:ABC transporter ATP-binding protein [Mangrovicoccus ximenensis]|uniref:ABC transporter ATP-binding protein n=1 Tax=Mangrovicoccus ximenensis TaxID=1911570 RepID=UPI000D38902E|nr:ABC transporter ATP-binding protein [Mangrovicoccus ximenensis]